MSKKNKVEDNLIDIDIDIKDIDKEINDFYIDKEKIESIEVPSDLNILIKNAINNAEKDIKIKKIKRKFMYIAASLGIILSVGIYNPVLAHKLPPVKNFFQTINDTLQVDEIASFIGVDKYIPKAKLDENGSIKFEVVETTEYKVNKTDEDLNKELKISDKEKNEDIKEEDNVQVNNLYMPNSEYQSIQFIHEMANSIIKAIDDRKYGMVEITPESVDIAITSLGYIKDNGVKEYLNRQLLNWKKGDFDNAVEVHNYVWNILGGEVGKAIAIKHDEVNKIKSKYFK
ncbi:MULTISPECIES: DUF6241 domain-containing protein [Romboutsia]|uniref:DUF6241 domain-containing protein n=1 Tax=Romboutsia TaxID=1501226 RepID=UPI00189A6967|nr:MULTISPECIES: DUF6241 domain-containing protein [Romboutsia]MCH1960525.1 DUF6241 domain-containing protein [Romboutsia hominis]MCH1969043.1 DUF6241 domain-containing protein [Romboutsia hominis]MDB8805661.1 DUF6241 domain-containing protein [Romboutsia sp. 1001216sp1]MDB8807513.1 DUF6241 domain-containing protein [Romboutsia sp. 1001216sp1]MDB8811136.1 DUF6241 domain-containing protein [Romboutsia sp. 1001216sp1]